MYSYNTKLKGALVMFGLKFLGLFIWAYLYPPTLNYLNNNNLLLIKYRLILVLCNIIVFRNKVFFIGYT